MWQQERNLACSGCGQPRDEAWIWSEEEQAVKQASWKAHLRTCAACAEKDFVVEQYVQANGVKHGRYPVLDRVDVPATSPEEPS